MRICAGIDQLGVDAHFAAGALHTALEQMRDAKLLRDLAQIALCASFVLHHRSAADHFQVGDFGEISQDFILHTVGEECVLLVVAEVFKRQNRD